jgi:hypothetical protein
MHHCRAGRAIGDKEARMSHYLLALLIGVIAGLRIVGAIPSVRP